LEGWLEPNEKQKYVLKHNKYFYNKMEAVGHTPFVRNSPGSQTARHWMDKEGEIRARTLLSDGSTTCRERTETANKKAAYVGKPHPPIAKGSNLKETLKPRLHDPIHNQIAPKFVPIEKYYANKGGNPLCSRNHPNVGIGNETRAVDVMKPPPLPREERKAAWDTGVPFKPKLPTRPWATLKPGYLEDKNVNLIRSSTVEGHKHNLPSLNLTHHPNFTYAGDKATGQLPGKGTFNTQMNAPIMQGYMKPAAAAVLGQRMMMKSDGSIALQAV